MSFWDTKWTSQSHISRNHHYKHQLLDIMFGRQEKFQSKDGRLNNSQPELLKGEMSNRLFSVLSFLKFSSHYQPAGLCPIFLALCLSTCLTFLSVCTWLGSSQLFESHSVTKHLTYFCHLSLLLCNCLLILNPESTFKTSLEFLNYWILLSKAPKQSQASSSAGA